VSADIQVWSRYVQTFEVASGPSPSQLFDRGKGDAKGVQVYSHWIMFNVIITIITIIIIIITTRTAAVVIVI
jgi:hypothetical protein